MRRDETQPPPIPRTTITFTESSSAIRRDETLPVPPPVPRATIATTMPPPAPTPAGPGPGPAAFRDDFGRIEELEQGILQHIRTAGLRKPKETSLVDELLAIRRERRRLFAGIVVKAEQTSAALSSVSDELRAERTGAEARNRQFDEKLTALQQASKERLQRREEELMAKHGGQVDEVRKRYETTIRQIGRF
jgi:hypothetical protein